MIPPISILVCGNDYANEQVYQGSHELSLSSHDKNVTDITFSKMWTYHVLGFMMAINSQHFTYLFTVYFSMRSVVQTIYIEWKDDQ
jgi:hypothetical protein